jgi:hypothetical protein
MSNVSVDPVARHRPGAGGRESDSLKMVILSLSKDQFRLHRESDSLKSVILSKTGLSGRRRRTSHYFARWMPLEEQ